MRKYKLLLTTAIVLFLLINTAYYWEGWLGAWDMLLTIILFVVFGALFICLIYHIYMAIKQKFTDKPRVYSTSLLLIILGLIFIAPRGLIDFEGLEGPDLLTAYRKGVAGCSTSLKLKKDHSFYLRQACFGVDKVSGRYTIDNDTIRFQYSSPSPREKAFTFATVTKNSYFSNTIGETINLYKAPHDTLPNKLTVEKDDLTMGQ